MLVPPVKKNGTSAPKRLAKSISLFLTTGRGLSFPESQAQARSVAAASEEPPPKPAPIGTFFLSLIAKRPGTLKTDANERAARSTRLSPGLTFLRSREPH